jgi:hypothetical protein
MPEKKISSARKLEDCLPSLPLKRRKCKKENQSFFIATFLCFPDIYIDLTK